MSDLEREIAAVTATVQTDWNDQHALDVERVFVRRYRRRQTVRRITKVSAMIVLLAGGGLALIRVHRDPTSAPEVASTKSDRVIRFVDGSTATPMSMTSDLRISASAPTRTLVALNRGGARFSVTKNPARVFRVEAGRVAIEVLGTKFAVERIDERVRVGVDEGRVRLLWEGGQRELGAGETGLFPPESPSAPPADSEPVPSPHKPVAIAREPKGTSWQALAQDGDYEKAYEVLGTHASASLSDEPAELLLLADVKRLSHHPVEAVAPLEKLITTHRNDLRAPLAAFTLGRVLLEELGRPNEAAEAFAQTNALAPNGALAQDSLAREVEAWSRAGDSTRSRARAEEYIRRYPDGRKLRSVRRFGGIE